MTCQGHTASKWRTCIEKRPTSSRNHHSAPNNAPIQRQPLNFLIPKSIFLITLFQSPFQLPYKRLLSLSWNPCYCQGDWLLLEKVHSIFGQLCCQKILPYIELKIYLPITCVKGVGLGEKVIRYEADGKVKTRVCSALKTTPASNADGETQETPSCEDTSPHPAPGWQVF